MTARNGTTRGFRQTASLLGERIRRAGESRGFAVARVLTHWAEIAGEDIAAIARPVDVRYGRGSFGATLTLLTTGAQAPVLEMQKEALRARVNAAYGYNAISRIRITQTAATGFAEGHAQFDAPRKAAVPAEPAPERMAEVASVVTPVADEGLRAALERLGRNVLVKSKG